MDPACMDCHHWHITLPTIDARSRPPTDGPTLPLAALGLIGPRVVTANQRLTTSASNSTSLLPTPAASRRQLQAPDRAPHYVDVKRTALVKSGQPKPRSV